MSLLGSTNPAIASMRIPMAEFIGTMIFVFFGDAANAQTAAFNSQGLTFPFFIFGFGLGLCMAIYFTAHVSAHFNPAVTLSFALYGKSSWKMVPVRIVAQMLGAFVAAALVYFVWLDVIDQLDGGVRNIATARIFTGFPAPGLTNWRAAVDQFVGSALLIGIIFALTDKRNNVMPQGNTAPIVIGLVLLLLGCSMGYNTEFTFNPARDFGPRVFACITGWGNIVWTANASYFWIPLVIPFFGAPFGAAVYSFFVYREEKEPLSVVSETAQGQQVTATPGKPAPDNALRIYTELPPSMFQLASPLGPSDPKTASAAVVALDAEAPAPASVSNPPAV